MEGRWCTASDVVADVSRAGGRLPPAPLADACLAWGERPAPIVLTEPELVAAPAVTPEHAAPPPDLRGITRMLRMVQAEDTDQYSSATGDIVISKLDRTPVPSYRPKAGRTQLTNIYYEDAKANDATAVNVMTSDLNPNVAEFVPSSLLPAPRGPSDGIVGNVDSVGCQAGGRTCGQEREELAARLREDIRGGHEKYTAIARLMRLYAQPAPAPAPSVLTPDYFEREAAAPERAADGNQNGYSSRSTETALERMTLVGSHCVSPIIRKRQPEAEPKRGADLHDVHASVEKVRRWLDGEDATPQPPTRVSSRVLLGPVTFRSRVPASSARTPPPPPPPPAPVVRAYSPPRTAVALLHREYAARAAAAQAADPTPAATETLWTRLQTRLREKDAELHARRAANT